VARLIRVGEFVGRGERKAAEYLERKLPASWTVICNKEIVTPDGSTREVDFILVGDHAVFACEEKSWDGPIHGNADAWVLRSGESYPSPIRKSEFVARRVAGFLRNQVPLLAERVRPPFVLSRVLLTGDDVRLAVHDPRTQDHALRLDGCEAELLRTDRLQGSVASIAPFQGGIVDKLTTLQDRPKIPRRVADYEVLEVVSVTPLVRTLRARHRDGTERSLRMLARPSSENSELVKRREEALLREYHALRRLADTRLVPGIDPYFSWDQDNYWVVPVHPVSGRSLRADRTDAVPTEERAWRVLPAAFQALATIHQAGVVHRSISPDRVFLSSSDAVCVTDFAIARIADDISVAGSVSEIDPEDAYRAPECRVDPGLAEPASDVFSLAASLAYWLTGEECESLQTEEEAAGVAADVGKLLGAGFGEVFRRCLSIDDRTRLDAATAAAECSRVVEAARQDSRVPVVRVGAFEPGTLVAGQYRVVRSLGRGATATTYLVEDTVVEGLFVLKVLHNPETARDLARAEFRSLMRLAHRHLPRVYDVRPPDAEFHIKTEYVPGTPLSKLPPPLRVDPEFRRVALGTLAALQYLQEHDVLHRDISPNNILVPEDPSSPLKLIDFGLATADAGCTGAVGTRRYRAPEVERNCQWTHASDVYALAVTLFEWLTGRLPYADTDGLLEKERMREPNAEERPRYGDALLAALMRGAAPNPDDRFSTAADLASAMTAAMRPHEPTADGDERVNPTVDALRQQFRDSRIGNTDNRGLDTPFAAETYVETRLDRELLPQILIGAYRLVVLSGNPGDGKTAFLQRLRRALETQGAGCLSEDATGWVFGHDGRRYAALYDASESDGDRTADDLLRLVLQPLEGEAPSEDRYTALVAVNDGRLLGFFESQSRWYPWVWEQVRAQIYDRADYDPRVIVLDLKSRSLVQHDPTAPSLFAGISEELLKDDRWAVCAGCRARTTCPVLFNARSLGDPELGPHVRRQLHELLLASHLRRERRATIRDLRSALGFLITHDIGCRDVHAANAAGADFDPRVLYFNAAFDGSGGSDLLLGQWRELEPAETVAPSLERFLFFHRQPDRVDSVERLFVTPAQRPALTTRVEDDLRWLREAKRRYFFEGRISPDPTDGYDLPDPGALLPYRYVAQFRAALTDSSEDVGLLEMLLRGLSRADGVPAHACSSGLHVRMTQGDRDDLIIVKRFPPEEFRLTRGAAPSRFVETAADKLSIVHREGTPRLEVGIDMFEYLMRAAEGFLAGPEEQRALAEDIVNFKNQLLARPTLDVVLIEPNRRAHAATVRDGRIVIESLS
jgi:serine/threonine protein kinase